MSKTRGMHQGDPGVVMTVGEALEGLSLSSILFVHFSLVDLGLGFQFFIVKTIRDRFLWSFLFPNKIYYLAQLWYH
jgi:hypothetical protein